MSKDTPILSDGIYGSAVKKFGNQFAVRGNRRIEGLVQFWRVSIILPCSNGATDCDIVFTRVMKGAKQDTSRQDAR